MAVKTSRLLSLVVAWGVGLQAFGVVYFPEGLGFLAASPGVLVLLVAAFVAAVSPKGAIARGAWMVLAYGLLVSAITVGVFGWNPLYGAKFATLAILSVVWFTPVLCIDHLKRRHVERAVIAGLAISAAGYLASDLMPWLMPTGLKTIIFGNGYDVYHDLRPRGFMGETSQFAALTGRYAMILFLLKESQRRYSAGRLVAAMVAIALMLAVTGSKGAAISVVVALLSVSLGRRQIPYLLLLAPVAWFIVQAQADAISVDIENFTSTSTRVGLIVAAAAAMAVNPLGFGYYGFYGAMQSFGTWSMDTLSDLPFIFTELKTIVDDLTNVSFKSTLLDFGVMLGLPFWIFMIRLIRRIDLSDHRARAAVIFFVLSSLSTSSHDSIAFFLGIAVLVRFYPASPPQRVPATAASRRQRATTDLARHTVP